MFNKILLFMVALLSVTLVSGSLPIRISLENLVAKTDHVFMGHVTDVDMIDGEGNQIHNEKAMTGLRLMKFIQKIVNQGREF